MGVIPDELAKREPGKFIRGEEFEGAGLTLEVVGFEKTTSEEYGADEKNWLVTEGKLEVGGTFKYSFKNTEGEERVFESNSPGLFIAYSQVNPDAGAKVHIVRTGKTNKTRYQVSVV